MLGVGQQAWEGLGSFIEAYHGDGPRSWLIFNMYGRQVYRYTYKAKLQDEDDWPNLRAALDHIRSGNADKVINIAHYRGDVRVVMFTAEAGSTDIAIRLALTRRTISGARSRLISADQEPLWINDLGLAEPILKRCNATGG